MLSEAEDNTLQMSEPAQAIASLSRLTHVINKLEKRGYV